MSAEIFKNLAKLQHELKNATGVLRESLNDQIRDTKATIAIYYGAGRIEPFRNRLLEGTDVTFSSESDSAECFFSKSINKFCIMFNSKLETFKKYKSFEKRLGQLIAQYELSEQKKPLKI